MAKYLYWRGNSLWCRYKVPGWPDKYPIKIKASSTKKTERATLERTLGEPTLSRIKAAVVDERVRKELAHLFFENSKKHKQAPEKVEEKPYNPKYWRIVARYWHHHLRHQKCAPKDKYHLKASLAKFGDRYAKDIHSEDIADWLHSTGDRAVNTRNLRLAYVKQVFKHANLETNKKYRLEHNPAATLSKLPGAKVRQALLTPASFQRNYDWLVSEGYGRYAFLYLMCWETGRRPEEVAQYQWEMVTDRETSTGPVPVFVVPGNITKTNKAQDVVISTRLWDAMQQLGYRHGFVARNADGGMWQNWWRYIKKLRLHFKDEAVWLRDSRRGFTTRKIENEKKNPFHVMRSGGWTTMSTVKRYNIGQIDSMVDVMRGTPSKGTNPVQCDKEVAG